MLYNSFKLFLVIFNSHKLSCISVSVQQYPLYCSSYFNYFNYFNFITIARFIEEVTV